MTYTFALLAAAFLTACGGGGGGGSGTPPVVAAPAPVASITNPLAGAAAPGSPTTSVSGTAVAGASVTAYAVNPDGSSGAALGAAITANSAGEFTLPLTAAPTSWVRLVSRGGKINRQADNSYHPVESMELVTPFITTSYNNLKISPVTDVASRIMTYKAKTGSTLVDAFKFGMVRTLQLDVANLVLQDDPSVYLNVLKGSITTDKGYSQFQSLTMSELLMGIERFGVMYDLPANQVWRVIAAVGENSYPLATVDGAGAAVNVGAWINGTFDPHAVMSLKTLMNARTLDEIKVTDSSGARVAPKVSDMVSRYIIQEALANHACQTGFTLAFTERYPFFPLDATGNIPASTCADIQRRMADFYARMESNNSRNLK